MSILRSSCCGPAKETREGEFGELWRRWLSGLLWDDVHDDGEDGNDDNDGEDGNDDDDGEDGNDDNDGEDGNGDDHDNDDHQEQEQG